MTEHEARPDASISTYTLRVEMQAMAQVCLHGLAHVMQVSYPTLLTTARGLARTWSREPSAGRLRTETSHLVREFLGVDCQSAPSTSIRAFAAECFSHRDTSSRLALRAYVSLTEAYNLIVTGAFLTRREWLCPWSHWGGYVYKPWWEDAEDFILAIAALEGTDGRAVEARLTSTPPACVSATVSRIVEGASGMSPRASVRPPSASEVWIGAEASQMCQGYGMSKSQAKLVAALQWYLSSGQLLIRRQWWGYRLV